MSTRLSPGRLTGSIISVLVIITALTGCSLLDNAVSQSSQTPTSSSSASGVGGEPVADPPTGDYYSGLGPAQLSYTPSQPGVIEYCPLDDLGRTVCAYGELTSSLRDEAQAGESQDIDVDPAGWYEDNSEVVIPALASIQGSNDYSGWFWNRSHLIADSLGGDVLIENLVTGTRTQNVGSTQTEGQYSGGMAYTELLARDYLDFQDVDACPLYYAATPVYTDTELIPRTVIVDIQSCDQSIDQRVEVSNTANGWDINYTTGEYSPTS